GQGGRAGGTLAANASDGQAARTFAGGGASRDSAGARRWRGGAGGMGRGGFGRGGLGGGPTRPGGLAVTPEAPDTSEASALKPGTIYVLRNDKPQRVPVLAGITDGAFTEVVGQQLQVGDPVIVGMDVPVANSTNNNLQPPPGMGGPRFGGRGGGGGGRGR
ncbi:MAG TPA: hypothetical protein VFK69_03905, partial [Candidatus Eisenbacteria bacterium]|nr:hypothetical protein [Candidatus Eisenbacteria bacterium]